MKRKLDDQYTDEESQRRFEAALRGAREVGHESMKEIPQKRPKPLGTPKVKADQKASEKRGLPRIK